MLNITGARSSYISHTCFRESTVGQTLNVSFVLVVGRIYFNEQFNIKHIARQQIKMFDKDIKAIDYKSN